MNKRLYVGNLSYSVDSDTLEQWFAEHGTVKSSVVITDRETGQSKGFGFIEMDSGDQAQAAIDALDGQTLEGRPIRVNEARPREDRPRGGGGGRY